MTEGQIYESSVLIR